MKEKIDKTLYKEYKQARRTVRAESLSQYQSGSFLTEDDKHINKTLIWLLTILIPLLTVPFLFFLNPLERTMTYMGNHGHRVMFLVWGFVTATLLSLFVVRIFNTFGYKNRDARSFVRLAFLFLIICVLTPSLSVMPAFSKVHNITVCLFAIFINLAIIYFLLYVLKKNKKWGTLCFVWFGVTLLFPATSLIIFGVTGLFEILFFLGMCFYLNFLYLYLSKRKF